MTLVGRVVGFGASQRRKRKAARIVSAAVTKWDDGTIGVVMQDSEGHISVHRVDSCAQGVREVADIMCDEPDAG
jgi:hypothetical protein